VAVGPVDVCQWDARAVRSSSDPRGTDGTSMQRVCREVGEPTKWAGPGTHSTLFYLFKCFQTHLNLNQSKDVLLLLKNFQLKYGIVGN
jgi:hypothetical protein